MDPSLIVQYRSTDPAAAPVRQERVRAASRLAL
ncbi:hypothetical protein E9232_002850 [Inquilinus ginsengisoli]|uniref:Uncharacterized protein n=1 Tax=Inquilinus ginsengisoli TaxID=363840 RepID=A0ABU1JRY9_9PROT|nr:hypothetical protein [Inquilinus ginsengisoli]